MKLKIIPLASGILMAVVAYSFILFFDGPELAARMGGVITLMATWWITEAIDLSLTALLPVALLPILGIMGVKEVAPNYFNQIIFLFVGGFVLAFAMEKWGLHIKVAQLIINKIGGTPTKLLLGFMCAAYFLSMWISNTATTMILLPAALAIIDQLDPTTAKKFTVPFLLSIAYASNIGGTATLVGTPPNAFFASFYEERTGIEVTFAQWSSYALPVSLLFLIIAYFYFRWRFTPKEINPTSITHGFTTKEGLTYEQKIIGIVFVATILLWVFRAPINIGDFHLPGWSSLFKNPKLIKDSSIAILSVLTLALIPSKTEKRALVTYNEVKRLPVGMLFLFGAGFVLAAGVEESGLSHWISIQLESLQGSGVILVLLLLCTFMVFFTDFTSNIAAVQLVLPIVIIIAQTLKLPPIFLMAPVTISASFAFLLPVSTPPNTIVFGSGRLQAKDFIKTGLFLDVLGVIIATASIYILGGLAFNI